MQKCIRSLVLELNTVLELVHKFRLSHYLLGGGGGEDLEILGKITWFLGEVKGIIRRQQGIKGGL